MEIQDNFNVYSSLVNDLANRINVKIYDMIKEKLFDICVNVDDVVKLGNPKGGLIQRIDGRKNIYSFLNTGADEFKDALIKGGEEKRILTIIFDEPLPRSSPFSRRDHCSFNAGFKYY